MSIANFERQHNIDSRASPLQSNWVEEELDISVRHGVRVLQMDVCFKQSTLSLVG